MDGSPSALQALAAFGSLVEVSIRRLLLADFYWLLVEALHGKYRECSVSAQVSRPWRRCVSNDPASFAKISETLERSPFWIQV